jgi:hypothetical protein
MIEVKTRKIAARESASASAKRDRSPKWEGAEEWTGAEFGRRYREAMSYYNLEHTGRELKSKVIDWMGRNDYNRDQIQAFKDTKDWRCSVVMGGIASCLLRGMPESRPDFNGGRNTAEWLRNAIATAVEEGKEDEVPVVEVKKTMTAVPEPTIQDKIRDQAVKLSEDIDYAIDSWIVDSEGFDPKAYKILSMLRGRGCKAQQARYIKSFFQRGHDELMELASGNADEQLREAYSRHARKNVRKLIEFYQIVLTACDQIAAEAKVIKKPRARKVKPAEDLAKRVKFKVSDDKLGITSVPPAQLVRAQAAVVYNTKTRKLGLYHAANSEGFGIKGTTIINFTEKSFQKTLRKPAVELKEFKEQNTQKRVETWFGKIKTTETVLTGRLNEDVVILKVFK